MSSLSAVRLAKAVTQNCGCANLLKKNHKALTAAGIKLHRRNLSAEPSAEHIFRSSIPDVELPNKDVFSLMYGRSRSWGQKDAIECGITGRKYTYDELMDGSLRWGAVLKKIMTGTGTVAVMTPNCPEYPMLLLGTVAVGGTVTTVSPSYVKAEVARQIENADVEVIVVDASLESLAIGACADLQKSLPILVLGQSSAGNPNLIEILSDKSAPLAEPTEAPLDHIGFIPYSSGTTGLPKGVAVSQGAISNNLVCFTNPVVWPLKDASGSEQSTVIGVLPFYHIYGLHIITMMTLYSGGKIVSLPTFTPQDYVRIIKDHKVDVLHTVPPILNFLVGHPSVTPEILESVDSVFCGAAPVPQSAAEKFKEKTKPNLIFQEGFGMTEVLGSHMTPVDDVRLGFCGKPIPNTEVKIVDIETGKTVPAGERGEMCIRGPQLMSHYHKNPTATAESIIDGWFHTGDIVIASEDGFFSIVDRMKELIKVKGLQVAPSELENILLQLPGVQDIGVVAVPDERAGELPRAYIITDGSVTQDQINAYMKEQLAPHKQLAGGIKFVDELPKSPTGKLLRKELKKMAEEEL